MKTEKIMTGEEVLALSAQLEAEGRPAEAEKILRSLIKADPKNALAYNRLGGLLFKHGDRFQALYCFERALKIDRRYVAALSNRGTLLGELGHYDESETDLRLATHLQSNNPHAWNSLGNTLMRLGRYSESLTAVERALALTPDNAVTHFNRGCVLSKLGQHQEAIRSFDQTLAREPNFPDARYDRAISMLHLGHPGAWDEYEARFACSERIYRSPSTAPRWDGAPLEGKTILLWAEQGLGDSIMFMRYVRCVLEQKPEAVFLYVHTALRALCRDSFEGVTVLDSDKDLPPHDVQYPLMSMPRLFPARAPWKPSVPVSSVVAERCVGIAWAGNPGQGNDANRSMRLADLAPLFKRTGISLVSLQKEIPERDRTEFEMAVRAGLIIDLGPTLTDMRETARAIRRLDIVVTVDTSVAHLAASLGARTWIMLCRLPCWRYGREGASPWYPDATLFRQPRAGDWASVARAVTSRLDSEARKAA